MTALAPLLRDLGRGALALAELLEALGVELVEHEHEAARAAAVDAPAPAADLEAEPDPTPAPRRSKRTGARRKAKAKGKARRGRAAAGEGAELARALIERHGSAARASAATKIAASLLRSYVTGRVTPKSERIEELRAALATPASETTNPATTPSNGTARPAPEPIVSAAERRRGTFPPTTDAPW